MPRDARTRKLSKQQLLLSNSRKLELRKLIKAVSTEAPMAVRRLAI